MAPDPRKSEKKPAVLRQPNRLLHLIAILLGLFVLIYAFTALTAFIRSQDRVPEYRDPAPEASAPATAQPSTGQASTGMQS